MKDQNFNPIIEAVVSIRHLALAITDNWTSMKTSGTIINSKLEKATKQINQYASKITIDDWHSKVDMYNQNVSHLKVIMDTAVGKIKEKKAHGISKTWDGYHDYTQGIKTIFDELYHEGRSILPENEISSWDNTWKEIKESHKKIEIEAESCALQLKMIEVFSPDEVDDLTDTILKHIPLKYSSEDAQQYTKEYIKAYEDIKMEAKQKKNLWDKFLDILAGGTQQTPAQRVMMQRWVDGEKGELH